VPLGRLYTPLGKKKQATVETALNGSECASSQTCVEQDIGLRSPLRYLEVPIYNKACKFRENELVVNGSSTARAKLYKGHNMLSYHHVREAVAMKIIRYYHIRNEMNPSYVAIQGWISKHEDYCKYVERVLPLLSMQQMMKHVDFSELIRNNWGLPTGKYLWIHYDENERIQRCVRRLDSTNMNSASTTGAIYYIYHRCHIDKVMVVAVTGYVFDGGVENGGDGLELGMWRV
jgi:hypothetical protein